MRYTRSRFLQTERAEDVSLVKKNDRIVYFLMILSSDR